MIGDNNLSYEKSPFTKVFLFLRNRELSVKGFLLDGTSLLYLSLAMGMENDDDRENVPIEEGEKILFSYRLTRVIYMDDGSHPMERTCIFSFSSTFLLPSASILSPH